MDYERKKKFIVDALYLAIIASLVYLVVQYGLGLLSPFLLAFLIAWLLQRPARLVATKTKLPRKAVALLLALLFYATAGVLLALLSIKLITSLTALVTAMPSIYTSQIAPALSTFFNGIEQSIYQMDPALVTAIGDLFNQLVQSIGELLTSLSVGAVSTLSGYATSLPGLFIKLLLTIIATFFISADYEQLAGFVTRQFSGKTNSLLEQIKKYVAGTLFVCIRSYALIMTITFVELSVGLTLIGVPNAILVALVIAIFDVLPVLGTGGIMIPWVILAAIQGNYPLAVGLLLVYLAITVIRNIIEPKIVGAQLGLHPIVTLASMFVGAQLLGVLGLFGFPIGLSLLRHLNDTGVIKLFR